MTRQDAHDNLREACIHEAMQIIETSGIEKLSMREVSRRLGVSHQAPYKHFSSRDHILAEILERSFAEFAAALEARSRSDDPRADFMSMGVAYLQYAAAHPLQYRLMFGSPLPEPDAYPAMMGNAQRAFSLLREAVQRMGLDANPDMDALYVWSTVHGLASILQLQMFERLAVAETALEDIVAHVLARIGTGIGGGGGTV